MSAGPGRREVAVRCFAAEYDDADYEYSESDEERAPNYVVTPTGARVNRLFVVGVLTEVEPVSDDVLRARVVDPTGAFVVYAGQYQPDAKTFLERTEPPTFVAVTGKARTFEPDDGDVVYTSVRPESITAVDADTRDRWTVQAAEQTLDRVAVAAAALDRDERGDALRGVLLAGGVEDGLAAGIPRAIDHYGTTPAYLDAVRDLAIEAAEVVAGDRDEVGPLAVAPDEDGPVELDLSEGVDLGDVEPVAEPETATPAAEGAGTASATTDDSPASDAEEDGDPDAIESTDADDDAETGTTAASPEPDDEAVASEEPADPDTESVVAETSPEPDDEAVASEEPAAVDTDERYELGDEERAEIEEEFGTEFATGNEVDDAGEADIETPGPIEEGSAEPADEVDAAGPAAEEPEAGLAAEDDDSEGGEDADLEDAVVEAMADLDDGDGADRAAVVEAVADGHGVDEADVEAAIQDALMAGRCYESGDDRLTAI